MHAYWHFCKWCFSVSWVICDLNFWQKSLGEMSFCHDAKLMILNQSKERERCSCDSLWMINSTLRGIFEQMCCSAFYGSSSASILCWSASQNAQGKGRGFTPDRSPVLHVNENQYKKAKHLQHLFHKPTPNLSKTPVSRRFTGSPEKIQSTWLRN